MSSSVASRYECNQPQQEQYQPQQQKQHNNIPYGNFENIHSTSSVWLSGNKNRRRPTLFLPEDLANAYGLAKPCRIGFFAEQDGILIKFLHPLPNPKHKHHYSRQHNNNSEVRDL